MAIRKSTTYVATDGQQFAQLSKAIDHSEERVVSFMKNSISNHPAYKHDMSVMLGEFVLNNREQLRELLDFSSRLNQFEEDEDDD